MSRTKQKIGSAEEAAALDLARTVELLAHPVSQLFKAHELSMTQYNVLRILRGAKEGLTCGEIANRMISRDPDITRLLDRLEKRSLIARARDDKDRRVVLTQITPEGLELLAALDGPVLKTHAESLGHMGEERLAALRELLAACREKLG